MDLKGIQHQRLYEYLKAEEAILNGAQSYQIADRTLTRANLKEIRDAISALMSELNAKSGVKRVVFIE